MCRSAPDTERLFGAGCFAFAFLVVIPAGDLLLYLPFCRGPERNGLSAVILNAVKDPEESHSPPAA
jgi:hypothetical protein